MGKHDEQLRKIEAQEQEDLDRAIKESIKIYESFHKAGDDVFAEALRESLLQAQSSSYERDSSEDNDDQDLEAIMDAYNETGALVDDENGDPPVLVHPSTGSPPGGIESSDVAQSGYATDLAAPNVTSKSSLISKEIKNIQDAQDIVLQTSPQKEVFASPRAGTVSSDSSFATEVSTTNLHDWLLQRADELQVDFDREVLWFTLNEIDWT